MKIIKKKMVTGLLASMIGFVSISQATTITLTAGDSVGTSSYNSAGNWSVTSAPTAGNDYVVALEWLRTPTANDTYYAFGGDSLTIAHGGGLIFKSERSTHDIDNLIMVDGGKIWGGNASGGSGTILTGNLTVMGPTSPTIHANQSNYELNSYITGTGDLTLAGGYSITMNGTNEMTGDIIVAAGTKTFSPTSVSIFTIDANGVNNAISGAGATFNGTFMFDLTGASTIDGHNWAVTTAGASFGPAFTVNGFSEIIAGTWRAAANGTHYDFDTTTGLLMVADVGDLEFGITSPIDGVVGVSRQPLVEADIVEVSQLLDTGSVILTFDGATVSYSLSQSGGTSTVSHAVSAQLDAWSVHTARVVAAITQGNYYTNEWSFTVTGPNIIAETSPKNFAVLSPDGGWCWYSDPRALFHNGKLYYGYVRPTNGKTILDVFDLITGANTNLWVSDFTEVDDHNVPGLCVKQDGSMLATYARHITDQFFAYRTSGANPDQPADWTTEQRIANSGAGMTYANPFALSNEGGTIYNYCRNLNFNPTVYTSTDGGSSWSAPQQFIAAGSGGTRPYVKYCSDGLGRIDFLYTDGHPRDENNSLYHLYYDAGSYYKTDESLVKTYADLPIDHSNASERGSVIYQYNESAQADPNEWIAFGRAWCWETANEPGGNPVSVFTVQKDLVAGTASGSDDRIYYYYARWTGTEWQKRFIAHAGRPLYNAEDDYAGGICVDPQNPNVIYISSNSEDPFNLSLSNTGLRPDERYEIWKGVTSDGGLTFVWEQITMNSAVDNLRPYIPRRNGGELCVLWFRGTYNTYTSFSSEMVGLFTSEVPVPPPSAPITYIDATSGVGGNTVEWNGASWETFSPPLNINGGGDDLWEEESGAGWGNGPTENWFEANREGAEDAPQLRTTVSGLPDQTYDVYAYFWAAGGQVFLLGGAFTNNPLGSLPLHTPGSSGVTAADAAAFTTDVSVSSADRILYQVLLGTITGSTINVYIDDDAEGGNSSSVWYDGIGYKLHLATVPADINIGATADFVTVSWPETHQGWMLQSTTNLTDQTWEDVDGSAANSSWSIIPDGSTRDAEFFRIRYPLL